MPGTSSEAREKKKVLGTKFFIKPPNGRKLGDSPPPPAFQTPRKNTGRRGRGGVDFPNRLVPPMGGEEISVFVPRPIGGGSTNMPT